MNLNKRGDFPKINSDKTSAQRIFDWGRDWIIMSATGVRQMSRLCKARSCQRRSLPRWPHLISSLTSIFLLSLLSLSSAWTRLALAGPRVAATVGPQLAVCVGSRTQAIGKGETTISKAAYDPNYNKVAKIADTKSNQSLSQQETNLLEGPRQHSSEDIIKFLNTNPSAVIKNLTISNRLKISSDQQIKTLDFYDVIFEDGVDLEGVKGNIGFYNSVFKGPANFYLAQFSNLHCEECKFIEDANFHSVTADSFWLNKSIFKGHAIFVNARIKGLLNLADVSFEKTVDFSGATLEELNPIRVRNSLPIRILWGQFGEKWLEHFYSWALAPDPGKERWSRLRQIEMALQFWRNNFSQLGLKRDELEANYELIRLERKYFLDKTSSDWWASVILEMPSRYGTRPYRPLKIGLVLVVIFGLFYWIIDPFEKKSEKTLDKKPLMIFSLLYSIDTFIPLINITGIKEWGWTIVSKYRWIELLERLLGLAIATLAAYSIGSHAF